MGEKFSPSAEGEGRWVEMKDPERAEVYGNIHERAADQIDADGYDSIPQDMADKVGEREDPHEKTVENSHDTVSKAIEDAFRSQFPGEEEFQQLMDYAVGYLKSAPENVILGVGNIDYVDKQDKIVIYKDTSDAQRWKVRVEKPGGDPENNRFNGYLFPLGANQKDFIDNKAQIAYDDALGEFTANSTEDILKTSLEASLLEPATNLKVCDVVTEKLGLGKKGGTIGEQDGIPDKRWEVTCTGTEATAEVVDVATHITQPAQAIVQAILNDTAGATARDRSTGYPTIQEKIALINPIIEGINSEDLKTLVISDLKTSLPTLPYTQHNADYTTNWEITIVDNALRVISTPIPPEHTEIFNAKKELEEGPHANGASVQAGATALQEALNTNPTQIDELIVDLGLDVPIDISTEIGSEYTIVISSDAGSISVQPVLEKESLAQTATTAKDALLVQLTANPINATTDLTNLINELPEEERAEFAASLGITPEGLAFDSENRLPYLLKYDADGLTVELNQEELNKTIENLNRSLLEALASITEYPTTPATGGTLVPTESFPGNIQAAIQNIKDLIEKTPANNMDLWDFYQGNQIITYPNYEKTLIIRIEPTQADKVLISTETTEFGNAREALKTLVTKLGDSSATPTEVQSLQSLLQADTGVAESFVATYFPNNDETHSILEVAGPNDTTHTIKVDSNNAVTTDPELEAPNGLPPATLEQGKRQLTSIQEAIKGGTNPNQITSINVTDLTSTITSVEGEQRTALLTELGLNGDNTVLVNSPGTQDNDEHKIPWLLSWNEGNATTPGTIEIQLDQDLLAERINSISDNLSDALNGSTDHAQTVIEMQTFLDTIPSSFDINKGVWLGRLTNSVDPSSLAWCRINTTATDPPRHVASIESEPTTEQKTILTKFNELKTAINTNQNRETPLQALNSAIALISDHPQKHALIDHINTVSAINHEGTKINIIYNWIDPIGFHLTEDAPTDDAEDDEQLDDDAEISSEEITQLAAPIIKEIAKIEPPNIRDAIPTTEDLQPLQTLISALDPAKKEVVLERGTLNIEKELWFRVTKGQNIAVKYTLNVTDANEVSLQLNFEKLIEDSTNDYNRIITGIETSGGINEASLDAFSARLKIIKNHGTQEQQRDLITSICGERTPIGTVHEFNSNNGKRMVVSLTTEDPYLRLEEHGLTEDQYNDATDIPINKGVSLTKAINLGIVTLQDPDEDTEQDWLPFDPSQFAYLYPYADLSDPAENVEDYDPYYRLVRIADLPATP
ncbi:hypothetical protein HN748_03645 [Candidatus Peregrinibacteria bacterium]|jgi:hypothetical protein|nr:hypothetical protein [Candidatus Peregrinibacteria bacterium]MBT7483937.1 hypothetical protein [Candidatus Peregrinibacteria bacterium]MBT7703303.1 hypothetical protein [Candidatus Peregrinibacteria bacterium]